MGKIYKINTGILNPESPQKCKFTKDGTLIFNEDGHILYCGPRKNAPMLNLTKINTPADAFIIPGLVDCHTHLSQYYVRGHRDDALLGWLKNHIFPAERKFKDPKHATLVAKKFYRRLVVQRRHLCRALHHFVRFPTSHTIKLSGWRTM
ncbi:hypothetical protein HY768_11540 [candidate division TA06 bacterium]|uniref:Amidohydrolase-related domain-containing protein n=1 Tax=candidate division TA06 bacterium TaxID=2250710 RepID=A0A933ID65_UNCT6|nr:hypothetical protein [candidate division TA06 bacterium]